MESRKIIKIVFQNDLWNDLENDFLYKQLMIWLYNLRLEKK